VSLCGETTEDHYREEQRDALDQSALLEVLDALRNTDAADRITQAAPASRAQLLKRLFVNESACVVAVVGDGGSCR
jgi:hypothetical protein